MADVLLDPGSREDRTDEGLVLVLIMLLVLGGRCVIGAYVIDRVNDSVLL